MDIRQFRYFITVAELLHFSRAAEVLGITPPSMTKQIQEIERDLGVRLSAHEANGAVDGGRRHFS
ncbi:LysR family transcriptional regulator [Ancylobacter dichloromethanicus]|uniref:LysR family transcriptional regulator n=1 Tax=Ancylobacter dichloromethanicus TaxID=518825 RepID=UPI0036185DE1